MYSCMLCIFWHIVYAFAYVVYFCQQMHILLILLKVSISVYRVCHRHQPSFCADDVPYRTLSTMSKEILQAMMPGVEVYEADMHEGFQMCP